MKKILLTTLLTGFAVSGANAANINYGNPMYRPGMDHFYSETSLDMNTDFEDFFLAEEFGYGITDKMSVFLKTTGTYDSSDAPASDDKFGMKDFLLGMSYRYMDQNNWMADVYGKVQQQYDPVVKSFGSADYNWTVGTKVGYMMSDWTFAGTAEANYINDAEAMGMKLGIEGQYVMDSNWNMVAGLDYGFSMGNDAYSYTNFTGGAIDNPMNAKLGVNYSMDETKYVGLYFYKNLKESESDDPFAMGVKFGIDF